MALALLYMVVQKSQPIPNDINKSYQSPLMKLDFGSDSRKKCKKL